MPKVKSCKETYPKRSDLRKQCVKSARVTEAREILAGAKDTLNESRPKTARCAKKKETYHDQYEWTKRAAYYDGPKAATMKRLKTLEEGRTYKGLKKCK